MRGERPWFVGTRRRRKRERKLSCEKKEKDRKRQTLCENKIFNRVANYYVSVSPSLFLEESKLTPPKAILGRGSPSYYVRRPCPHQNEQGEIKLVRTRKKLAGEGSHTAQLCSVSSFLLFPRGACFLGRTREGENEKVEKTSRLGLSCSFVFPPYPGHQQSYKTLLPTSSARNELPPR